ncbi:MAG TPA: pyridoxal-phosphate dependent enzyme [Thermoanaerobaculia bacterium]|jgi:threonine dehydratase|nr:pyridoxal-phosphate dependent enzyme [Thermoanaerobaculia bacterium]
MTTVGAAGPSRELRAPTLEEIRAARERLDGLALRTPLLRLQWEPPASAGRPAAAEPPPAEIYIKLENLQPIGSFKLRGAANAMLQAGAERLADGVYTASAGNMAQGVAWSARRLGVAATAVVPDHAPATKLAAIERLGGTVLKVPFETWWQVIAEHHYPGQPGLFIHPVSDTAVMAGNGTIGLEIAEQLPGVDVVLVPFGGGGLSCGIAAALRELRPAAEVFGCEVTTASPLAASFEAGEARAIDYQPSFVDGIGGKALLPEMWPLASRLLAGSRVVPLAAVAAAVRLLAERHRVIAEGAGATAVAVAMALATAGELPGKKIVCLVSGGNIDGAKLATILAGGVP